MASGIITGSTSSQNIDSKIEWSSTPSVENNSSSVTARLYYRRNNSGYTTSGIGAFSITINGAKKTASNVQLTIDTSWVLAMTATVTVAHKDDGSKAITISATGSLPPSSLTSTSCSGTATLDTIARASVPTVSASSVVMGGTVTISTNRKSTTLTHDLSYSFGGSTGTIATGVGASYVWTVPDLVSKISGKSSGTCTITCKTKSGSTVIGTKTVTLTLTIPAKSAPTAANTQMGKSVTIKTNRKSSGYTHTLSYTIGSKTDTIGTGVTDSKAWTPPKSLAAYTGNQTSAECTITCKTYNGSLLVGEATTKITLTVPDATVPKLSASIVAMGDNITISLPKEADVYTHDLAYEFAGEIVAFASGTSADTPWTVPLSLAAKIPSETEGTVIIGCRTRFKDSETVVGTKYAELKATVPDNSATQPKVTMTLSPVHNLSGAFSDVYVAGKSGVKVSYEASSDYSTIKSYLTELPNVKSNDNPYTSEIFANSGSVEITGKVTDAREYSTEKKESITVIEYSRPRIIHGEGKNNIICTRCNSDGTPDTGGVYLLIQIGRKYSKVVSNDTQRNFCKLIFRYKTDAQGDDAYSEPVPLLPRQSASDYVSKILPDIVSSNTTAYNIQLIAEDDVGETDVVTVTVPTVFVTFHAPPGGHGFTLGGYHDPAKYNVFDCWFDAEFHGNVLIEDKTLREYILSVISEGG